MADSETRLPGLGGRVGVVTGASGAIGQATARMLARQGAAVAVAARRGPVLEQLAESIRREGGRAVAVAADVTDRRALERVRDETERQLGAVELVAAVAGGLGEPVGLLELAAQGWRDAMALNLTSVFETMQVFLPGMRQRGRGAMVTVSSTAGRQTATLVAAACSANGGSGGAASPAYVVAKAGLLALTRHAAAELAPAGVRINAVAPGAVLNERMARAPAGVLDQIARFHPLGRIGEPDDVAAAALFLLSDAAAWITGATLDVNGGRIMV